MCLAVLGKLTSAAVTAETQVPIHLSENSQLFLDDYLVASKVNLISKIHKPAKCAHNPVIVREFPWEKRLIEIYGTALYDPQMNVFRMWYLANEYKDGIPDTPEYPSTAEYYQCYAESKDGINWTKPMVDVDKFGRYELHNVVIPRAHGFGVIKTPNDPDPNKRYKGAGGRSYGFSPDGIHWTLHDWSSAIGKNDTSTSIVRWNGEYLAYVRYQVVDPEWPAVMRGVGLSVSEDFENWTPKQLVFKTDARDGYPWTQPYGLAVTAYGDQLVGILWLLHLDQIENNNAVGNQDMQLVVSRDGRNWERVAERATFMEGTPEEWDHGRVFPGTTMIVKDDTIYIYYTGINTRHGEEWGNMGIGLATLPADRFVAMVPEHSDRDGILQTKLLDLSAGDLIVNAQLRDSDDLHVEIVDSAGDVVPGFGWNESRLISHDSLRYRVVWGDDHRRSIGQAADNQLIALRFYLKGGEIYAFQVLP